MGIDTVAVEPLPVERLEDVIDVLADAFAAYPVMRFIVGPDGDVGARERRLVRFFATRRVRRAFETWGLFLARGSRARAAGDDAEADG